MKTFDHIIKDYKIINANDIADAFQKLTDDTIVSCNDSIILEPGDMQIHTRDYISDFESDEPLYFVVDDREILIKNKTRFLTFMSPLKLFIIRNKTDKPQELHFKKYFMTMSNINNIREKPLGDGNLLYHWGSYKLRSLK